MKKLKKKDALITYTSQRLSDKEIIDGFKKT